MAIEVKLPQLGQGMETGTIVRWLRGEGDAVRKSDPLYELDTDKVTQEVEAEADGVLLKILVPEGDVAVGTTVAVIGEQGEEVSLTAPAAPVAPVPTVTAVPAGAEAAPVAAPRPAPGGATPGGRRKASPLARRIARERGVELAALTGTGPDGRITARDVEAAGAGASTTVAAPGTRPDAATSTVSTPAVAAPTGEVEVVPLSSIRKTIARRLSEAWTAPVFQLGVSVEMTEALALRETLVQRARDGDVKPTVNDLLVKLSAVALRRHPALNAHFTGDAIQRFPNAAVGIAVAAPHGLVVPVIREPERLTLDEIAVARADLVARSRENKLTRADLDGGTFTISNLGMFGVEQFVAVLNPPQVAILAVGAVKDEAVVVDGEIEIAPMMQLTLTCDHRAIDGADGAGFLRTLVELIEQPALAL
ncbi:MAG: dihydrolipoamide acetyltransferase family protein [Gaiellales bacterium]